MRYDDLLEIREIVKEIDEFMVEYINAKSNSDKEFYRVMLKISIDALNTFLEGNMLTKDNKLEEIRQELEIIEQKSMVWIREIREMQSECMLIRHRIGSLLLKCKKEQD